MQEDNTQDYTCKTCSPVYKAIAEHTSALICILNYPYHRVQAKAPGARRVELRHRVAHSANLFKDVTG